MGSVAASERLGRSVMALNEVSARNETPSLAFTLYAAKRAHCARWAMAEGGPLNPPLRALTNRSSTSLMMMRVEEGATLLQFLALKREGRGEVAVCPEQFSFHFSVMLESEEK